MFLNRHFGERRATVFCWLVNTDCGILELKFSSLRLFQQTSGAATPLYIEV